MSSKFNFVQILLAAVILLSVSSCAKNRTLNALEGTWEVTSYTEDGVELIGFLISAMTIEFEEYGENSGDCNITFILVDGSVLPTTIEEYECNDDGSEVDLVYVDGTKETYDFTVEGDDLEMEGTIDGSRYEISADRD
ncbi:MAG: hypothetical protein AAGH79_06310 [Bacteroidota bacterium]